ncbi:XRE family transcriptional regulator [Puteibacter caeruleilacunae]|nr:XRE family transcriptional regulator [Puteibacter caeruleilacunae]
MECKLSIEGITLSSLNKEKGERSISQKTHTQGFAVARLFAADIREVVSVSYASRKKGKYNAINALTSHIQRDALKGEYPDVTIDYQNLLISRGDLEAPKWVIMTTQEDGYLIEWDTEVEDKKRLEDKLIAVACRHTYCRPEGGIFDIRRKEGRLFVPASNPDNPVVECWIGFCTEDETKCCDSVYARRESIDQARKHQKKQVLAQKKKDEKRKVTPPKDSYEEFLMRYIVEHIVDAGDELDMKLLGEQIQELRKRRHYSQTKLGELIGMSRTHISRIETGEQDISTSIAVKIMKALKAKVRIKIEVEEDTKD